MRLRRRLGTLLLGGAVALPMWAAGLAPSVAQEPAPTTVVSSAYDIGTPVLRTIWVDPRKGRDGRSGATRSQAVRTLTAAWNRIPRGRALMRTGYRIMILPGTVTTSMSPNYWEDRHGTARFPILVQSARGASTVTLPSVNVYNTQYLYFVDLRFSSQDGDAIHCEKCDHFLVRNSVVRGMPPESGRIFDLLKINQSQHVYIEGNDISGASNSSLDFVAVEHGSILANRVHDAQDWCAWVKGGSAYIKVDGNEFYDCGTGGFTAGQGTGFQFMVAPWLMYEAYDVKITNNVAHDIEGAAFGVNGGYDVLIAYNTAYRVGGRDHLLEFVPGSRSCDGQPGDADRKGCTANLAQGGWGTTRVSDGENYVRIPNRHVFVYDNLIVNPPGEQSQWQQLMVAPPYSGQWQDGSHVAVPTLFDQDLRIAGNVIWDGPAGHPSGLGRDDTGCAPDNPTCNEARYYADNAINSIEPQLVAPRAGNFTVAPSSAAALSGRAVPVPDFGWSDCPGGAPTGSLSNAVPRDRAGAARSPGSLPGAYAS